MARGLIGIGSNLGDRAENLRTASQLICCLPKTWLLARSRWHETLPIGGPDGQPPFLNGAFLIETSLSPARLAEALHKIENEMGRMRTVRWDARSIDLDLLLYDDKVLNEPTLTVPHPRMSFRQFVLAPAAEIAGAMRHPTVGWTIAQLERHLRTARRLVVVTAAYESIVSWLTRELSQALGGTAIDEELGYDVGSSLWLTGGVQSPRYEPPFRPLRLEGFVSCSKNSDPRAALVLAANPNEVHEFEAAVCGKSFVRREEDEKKLEKNFSDFLEKRCAGPLAQLTSAIPATLLAEAVAAICSVWPDLVAQNTR